MAQYELIRPRPPQTTLQRFMEGLRSITLGPWNPKDPAIARYFGSMASSAGVRVDEESSLSYAAVWNAVCLIAGDIAKVPLPLYRRVGGDGKELFRDHPLYELMHDQPNEEMSSFVFRRTMQGHVLVWGNAYAEIELNGGGKPANLWPLMPYAVTPYREGGRLRYRVYQPNGGHVEFDRSQIFHLSGLGLDGIAGYPPIRKAMESIGLGIATQRFAAKFYENGAQMGTVITYPAGIKTTPQSREENRNVLEQRHAGVGNAHRLLALYEGAEVNDLGVTPDKAQFLETRRFNVEEVARWFNIPVHKLKELARSTNNNIEHQGIEYATDTLQPWFRMWEGELRLKLIPRLERNIQFFEHVTEALTRGDSAAQGALIGQQFMVGGITPNEVRGKFNMNPRPDGDDIYVPSNTMPADLARLYWEAQIAETQAKATAALRPPPTPTAPASGPGPTDAEMNALREAVRLAEEFRWTAEAALQTERAEHVETQTAFEALRETLQRTGDAAESERARRVAAEAVCAAAEQRTLDAQRMLDTFHADLLTEQQARRDDQTGYTRALSDAAAEAQRERDTLSAALKTATETGAQALVKVVEVQGERDAVIADRDTAVLRLTASDLERESIRAEWKLECERTAQAESERETALALASQMEQEKIVAGAKLTEAEAERDAAKTQAADAEKTRELVALELDALQQTCTGLEGEADTLRTELARARADLATEMEQQRTYKAVRNAMLLSAMRSLVIEASQRLLHREIDRARNNQATPEKLRAWIERFFPVYRETVRETFRPLVGPWTAITGGAPNLLLDRLVSEHIETSRTALLLVAEAEDPDQLAADLERTISRWEHERAETVADALVREGMAQ